MKYYKDTNIFKKRPVHVNLKIEPDQSAHDFEEVRNIHISIFKFLL